MRPEATSVWGLKLVGGGAEDEDVPHIPEAERGGGPEEVLQVPERQRVMVPKSFTPSHAT